MRAAKILEDQQPPQEVFVCDHAGHVINKFFRYRTACIDLELKPQTLDPLLEGSLFKLPTLNPQLGLSVCGMNPKPPSLLMYPKTLDFASLRYGGKHATTWRDVLSPRPPPPHTHIQTGVIGVQPDPS